MKLTAFATALVLLITIGAMSLSSSTAMAQEPSNVCADTQTGDDECQGDKDYQEDSDDSDDEAPGITEVEITDNLGFCVSDLWSVFTGNASDNC